MNLKKLLYIFYILTLLMPVMAQAQLINDDLHTQAAPTEYNHRTKNKPDQTGGLQKGAGLNLPISVNITAAPAAAGTVLPLSRTDLDPYRGPDVLNSCAYLGSSYIDKNDPNACCRVQALSAGKDPEKTCNPSTSGGGPTTLDCSGVCQSTDSGFVPGCNDINMGCIRKLNTSLNQCECKAPAVVVPSCDTAPNYQLDPSTNKCVDPCNPDGDGVRIDCETKKPCIAVMDQKTGAASCVCKTDCPVDSCFETRAGISDDCGYDLGFMSQRTCSQGQNCWMYIDYHLKYIYKEGQTTGYCLGSTPTCHSSRPPACVGSECGLLQDPTAGNNWVPD